MSVPGDFLSTVMTAKGLLDLGHSAVRAYSDGSATQRLKDAEIDAATTFQSEHFRAAKIVREQLRDTQRRVEDVEQQLSELLDDLQFVRLQRNYAEYARREPTDERLRMLAHASAGSYALDLTIAEKARVERILRELDPSDILCLKGLSLVVGKARFDTNPPKMFRAERELVHQMWKECVGADALASTHCVRVWFEPERDGGYPAAEVTDTGNLVLKLMRSFTATREPPFAVPGREVPPASRSEAEAWEVITKEIAPRTDLLHLCDKAALPAQYDFPKAYRPPAIPEATADGILHLKAVELSAVDQVLPHTSPGGHAELRIERGRPRAQDPNTVSVRVLGPHDVLRWWADAIRATWT